MPQPQNAGLTVGKLMSTKLALAGLTTIAGLNPANRRNEEYEY
jgi:hypothetical protein